MKIILYRWQSAGQFLVWEFEVEKDVLYTIYIKSRQNVSRGVISNRAIYIDNTIPFVELEDYDFPYSKDWNLAALEVSDSLVSRITDKILTVVKEWQQRPLENIYAVVFMDAIHYHVRSEGRIVKKAVYIAIGVDMDGKKDVLGMYVRDNESSKYWLTILNGLKNRGVEDILITCVDGLVGFPEAITAVYPKTEIQQCVIHQIRNGTKYVSYKDIKALMADLKRVYGAIDEETALYELEQFATKWDSKYPKISVSWKAHWPELSTYFKYPQSVRTLIYTTNSIENFNRHLRKVTKNKAVLGALTLQGIIAVP